MENSLKSSSGCSTEIPKKTKCLDLQVIYNAKVLEVESSKQRKCRKEYEGKVGDGHKKKSTEEFSLDRIDQGRKKRRKISDEGDEAQMGSRSGSGSGSGSVSTDMNGGFSGICYKNGLNGVPLSFGGNGNVLQFPKRPRCTTSRRRYEGDRNSKIFGSSCMIFRGGRLNSELLKAKSSGLSGSEAGLNRRGVELTTNSVKVNGSKVKGKITVTDVKESNNDGERSARDGDEGSHIAASNGDVSTRKRQSNFRRRKDLISVGESSVKKVEPIADNPGNNSDGLRDNEGFHDVANNCDVSSRKRKSNFRKRKIEPSLDNSGNLIEGLRGEDDDDEENLEQNAARMLSSRFDPKCTVFSSKSNSLRPFQNGVSFSVSSGPEFVCSKSDSLACVESESADSTSRILRPRKKRSQKGKPRKRRHFYEIVTSNFDAHWFLNRKIKVFWPLDGIWYYGLVNNYDLETKRHHVKYDDRDEEWINLQREKFKLLLLPSEVLGRRRQRKRASMSEKHVKIHSNTDDESSSGTFLDSEPIISWLVRFSRRIKFSSSNRSKKQKTLQTSPSSGSLPAPIEAATIDTISEVGSSAERIENSLMGSPSSSTVTNCIVYVRKRSRSKIEVFDFPILWSTNDEGLINLKISETEFKTLSFRLCSTVLPFFELSFKTEQLWLSNAFFLLPHYGNGTIISTWPEVDLEILFVDNNTIGSRFLLFEGCLKDVILLFSLILTVFNQPHGDSLPKTLICFKLYSKHDHWKKKVFAFYKSVKLRCSKWLYLDSKLKGHCLVNKKLPLSAPCLEAGPSQFQKRSLLSILLVANQPLSGDFHGDDFCPVISSSETLKEKISQDISHEQSANLIGFTSSLFNDSIVQSSTLIQGGFGTGPKKPRTQVQYSLPLGSYNNNLNSNHRNHNSIASSYKRIRRSNKRRICEEGFRDSHKNIESLTCDANVLVSICEKGWRESGARVVLETTGTDDNECLLAVKVSGVTKYSQKVNQILQPGSTNRYTHAMMWKGGKDWTLEFPDRNQWIIFKEIYEECHNRNIRAACVKNIPIPGVCLIEENDDYNTTNEPLLFIQHSPTRYYHQLESDVEMALNPSRVFYDMDNDDEQWIYENNNSKEISDELFEKTMDMLEKFAYINRRDELTNDELEELVNGFYSFEILKAIHQHWLQKRRRKGVPLIRHFQVPLWEQYQEKVKRWEEGNGTTVVVSMEKPAMFAFCLKPRGLEVISRGSKPRSHRRFPTTYGHSHFISLDHDAFHTHGRRLLDGLNDEYPDALSPREGGGTISISSNGGDVSEWNHYPKFNRNNKQKKNGVASSLASSPKKTVGMRNGVHRLDMDLRECPKKLLDGSDYHHEFRLMDAKGEEAQQARKIAKLKRERAERLLYRADLAVHKAAAALMTAETIKASFNS